MKTLTQEPSKRPGFDPQPKRSGNGYHTFHLEGGYSEFIEIVTQHFNTSNQFIWRGLGDSDYQLISSLTRILRKRDYGIDWQRNTSRTTTKHLRDFLVRLREIYSLQIEHLALHDQLLRILATEPRTLAAVLNELHTGLQSHQLPMVFDLFALGQHHGLATPLLDWTRSPLIALWFAFVKADDREDDVGFRVVYALNIALIRQFWPEHEPIPDSGIRVLDVLTQRNPRIEAQEGVFTLSSAHQSIEECVVSHFATFSDKPVLLRFLIRNRGRKACLSWLELAHIHFRSMYPDLEGAAKSCNYNLENDAHLRFAQKD